MSTASHTPLSTLPGAGLQSRPRHKLSGVVVPQAASLDIKIPINHLDDIVKARRAGRRLAKQMGCSGSGVALVLTAISELARNIIMYAGSGEIILSRADAERGDTVTVTAHDQGPGIADTATALEDGEGTGRDGLGLSGLRLVMDQFAIESRQGAGTRVTCGVLVG